ALIEFIFAAVMLAVSFLMNVYSKQVQQIGYPKIWAFGLVLDGFSYCPYYFVSSVPMLAAFAVLHASFIILIIIPRTTLIQRLAAKAELGNVFSLLNVAVSGMTAISVALTGWASERFGIREVFMVLGVLSGATGIWAWIALVSNARAFAATEPAAPEV
ncbi:MAG: MFS transporter, partial [Rhizobacter sp.]|nr:MFS transporter [Chlorobiales bacterium]